MTESRVVRRTDRYQFHASTAGMHASPVFSVRLCFLRLLLPLFWLGCDELPRPDDTDGMQRAGHWVGEGRLVIDTDPKLTIVRLRADTLKTSGHDVVLTRFDFDELPGLGDEYSLSLALDLGRARELPVGDPIAIATPPARAPVAAYATVTCFCRPLRPDSVRGRYLINRRGIAQLSGRIDATLFFTEWADSTRHVTYRLRQRLEAVK